VVGKVKKLLENRENGRFDRKLLAKLHNTKMESPRRVSIILLLTDINYSDP